LHPEFEEFRVESKTGVGTVSVGSVTVRTNVSRWKIKPHESLDLPPGEYRLEAIGPPGATVKRWRVEGWHVSGMGYFAGFAGHQDGDYCALDLRRGERVRVSIANWERHEAVSSAADFVPLFNGKDLTGWKTHPDQPGDWKVENGVLIGRGPRS